MKWRNDTHYTPRAAVPPLIMAIDHIKDEGVFTLEIFHVIGEHGHGFSYYLKPLGMVETFGEITYGEGDLAYDKVRADGDADLKRRAKENDDHIHRIHRLALARHNAREKMIQL